MLSVPSGARDGIVFIVFPAVTFVSVFAPSSPVVTYTTSKSSVTAILFNVTFPVFFTWILYVIISPGLTFSTGFPSLSVLLTTVFVTSNPLTSFTSVSVVLSFSSSSYVATAVFKIYKFSSIFATS